MDDYKKERVELYINNIANTLIKERNETVDEDSLKRGIEIFTSSKYDSYTEQEIHREIDKSVQQMLETLDRKRRVKKRNDKYEVLSNLYSKTKEKYGNVDYKIVRTLYSEHIQSYNETKEVELLGPNGETAFGFFKGVSSPNEYELLVSRIGKIVGIPVADYSLYLDNGQIDGISISCVPDKDKYEFISGYDFVKDYDEVRKIVSYIQANPNEKKPELTKDQTRYYTNILLKGFAKRVKNPEQLEQLKKDYFETVLLNAVLDQKDYNYSNFAVLHEKEKDSYKMAPLFDNALVKHNPKLEGTMITAVGRSKKTDIIDLIYNDHYEYISKFSKRLLNEVDKMQVGEKNIISDMLSCIDETLTKSEATEYKATVLEGLRAVLQKEQLMKQTTHEKSTTEFENLAQQSKRK